MHDVSSEKNPFFLPYALLLSKNYFTKKSKNLPLHERLFRCFEMAAQALIRVVVNTKQGSILVI